MIDREKVKAHLKAFAVALCVPAALGVGYYWGRYIPMWVPLGLIMLAVYASAFIAFLHRPESVTPDE